MPTSAKQGSLIPSPILCVGFASEARADFRKALETNLYPIRLGAVAGEAFFDGCHCSVLHKKMRKARYVGRKSDSFVCVFVKCGESSGPRRHPYLVYVGAAGT